MPQVWKKRKGVVKEVESRDRLSELPDEVLIHILSFLPTLGAVRTMQIRRFGELWTFVPNLDFCVFHMPSYMTEKHRFLVFVRNVLLLHQAPIIHSFRLAADFDEELWTCESVVDEVHMWIKCAIRKQPKIVDIGVWGESDFLLPQCLFTSQSIVELSLTGGEFKEQMRVRMGSLRSVRFYCVRFVDNEFLRDMVSGAPSFEKLEIVDCYMDNLTFPSESIPKLVFDEPNEEFGRLYCPKVKVLDFSCVRGCYGASDFSSICEASICFYDCRCKCDIPADETTELLRKFENAEILTFKGLSLKGVTVPQNRWKVLKLRKQYFSKPCIPWLSGLLINSPYLEELIIDAENRHEHTCRCDGRGRDPMCPNISSPIVANRLRKVHIRSERYEDQLFLLQLAEFFLKHAIVLDELVISCLWSASRGKRNLSNKISRFTRASTNVRITIDLAS